MDREIFPIESRVTLAYGLKGFEGESVNKLIDIGKPVLACKERTLIDKKKPEILRQSS